ncbi:MAG TPA: hypothetical protein PKM57_10415 [Kiritimatiellia bacterium]|nr:hypothetical protein [Kiritimatiellia bacterium]HPS07476.1 hypothetical protein [Kiritimatiellia bacterium]
MKSFGYTFRDASGALKKGTLQAEDRTDALRQIKAKGCVPVSVAEGQTAAGGPAWNPAWTVRGAWIAAAGVVLIGGLAVWHRAERKPVKRPAVVAADIKKAAPAAKPKPVKPVAAKPVQVPAITVPAADVPNPEPKPATAAALPASQPLPPPAPQPSEIAVETPVRPHQFKNKTEQLLSMAMSVPPGGFVPPLPISPEMEQDFAKSLTNEIVIFDDDDERTANIKENVAVAKNQLIEMVKQGRSVADVIQEYQKTRNAHTAARSEAQAELSNLYRSGKTQEAREYMEKVNKAFTELGIDPVSLPSAKRTAK